MKTIEDLKNSGVVESIYQAQEEKLKVMENMAKFGGSFVRHLAVVLKYADDFNTLRIKLAFPDDWQKYLEWHKYVEEAVNKVDNRA